MVTTPPSARSSWPASSAPWPPWSPCRSRSRPLLCRTSGAIALWVGIFAFVLVAILIAGDWYYVAGTFPAFAATFLWWIATGLDGWATNGGGVGNSIAALGDPATAGSGAFGGVISTPWTFVWLNTLVTLVCGCILGIVSAKGRGRHHPQASRRRGLIGLIAARTPAS